jgi:hypothetical protein
MTQIELIIGELRRSYGASTAPVKAHTEKDRGGTNGERTNGM